MKDRWILGINASHNGSVCLLKNEKIFVAIQEERLTRHKRARIHGAYPNKSLEYCFSYAGITASDVDLIVISVQGERTARKEDIRLNKFLNVTHHKQPFYYISHHLAHAVGVYACSGFSESAILIIDGVGSPFGDLSPEEKAAVQENVPKGWESISLYFGTGRQVKPLEKILSSKCCAAVKKNRMPKFGSLGGLFQAISFQILGQEMEAGKVMGLAALGKPSIPTKEFVRFENGKIKFTCDACRRFIHNDRWPRCEKLYADLAASAQKVLEESLLYFASRFKNWRKAEKLCYTGGVALNCLANEHLIRNSGFRDIFILPSADDSGVAIGAAYWGLWNHFQAESRSIRIPALIMDSMGKRYSRDECANAILRFSDINVVYSKRDDLVSRVAKYLKTGKIVGWFQGRSELGPRALGCRSILADPRIQNIKEMLNSRVKFREPFRPYAASILYKEAADWFDFNGFSAHSPFMLRAIAVKPEKKNMIQGVIHDDGTCRIQTVTKVANGRYYDLIREFFRLTGVPLILNTSFNTEGDAMVETPEDAVDTFIFTGMDVLVLGDRIITKKSSFSTICDRFPYIKNPSCIKNKPLDFIGEGELEALMSIVNGKRNVRSLAELLEKQLPDPLSVSLVRVHFRLTRLLLRLYRLGLIGFM
ncbi:MAG: hypothetical protein MIO92_08575 [Methanosarcinaceae archaeon]|nr:hypothetical protein [Methanosarcinaceae archaeon]